MTPAQRIDSSNARLRTLDFIVVFIRYSPFLNPEFPFFCRRAAHATLLPVGSSGATTVCYQLNLYCTFAPRGPIGCVPGSVKKWCAQFALAARRKLDAPLSANYVRQRNCLRRCLNQTRSAYPPAQATGSCCGAKTQPCCAAQRLSLSLKRRALHKQRRALR